MWYHHKVLWGKKKSVKILLFAFLKWWLRNFETDNIPSRDLFVFFEIYFTIFFYTEQLIDLRSGFLPI